MTTRAALALAVCAAGSLAAQEEFETNWRNMLGKPAPEITADAWLNVDGPPPSRDRLQGKVWLLAFYGAISADERFLWPELAKLDELHRKYFARGFRVIAISYEEAGKLRAELVEQRGTKIWIGSDPQRKTQDRCVIDPEEGVVYPRFLLVDVSGKVVGQAIPTRAEVESLLEKTFDPALERELRPELAKVRALYEGGAYGAAHRLAGRLVESKDRKVAEDARYVRKKVEDYAAFWRTAAEFELREADPNVAYGRLLVARHRFAGLDVARWAPAKLRELAKVRRVKDQRKAWKLFEKALKRDVSSAGTGKKATIDLYEDVVKKHPWTRAGWLARKRLEELGESAR